METKTGRVIWSASKFIVFVSLLYVSVVEFKIGNALIGTLILFLLSFYLIYNKIDTIDKRIKILDEKKNGSKMQLR